MDCSIDQEKTRHVTVRFAKTEAGLDAIVALDKDVSDEIEYLKALNPKSGYAIILAELRGELVGFVAAGIGEEMFSGVRTANTVVFTV